MLSGTIICLTCLLLALTPAAHADTKRPAAISGVLRDRAGDPLPSANVQIVGSVDGDATNDTGRFSFTTQSSGDQTLRASLIGYEPVAITLHLSPGDSLFFPITMDEALVSLGEVVVRGSAYTIGDDPQALTLHSLDVVSTAGTSADVVRAIQTLPGVVSIDEGAGLYVRGGDVSETVFLLDQATVVHPYKFESPTGGYFGTIPPFLLGGTFFSSGAFSSRYGNALSGVLAMETLDMPSALTVAAGAGLAAGSLGASIPIIPNVLGVRFSGNTSFTDAMLRMNGTRNRFTVPPDGYDANASIIWRYLPNAQIKLLSVVTGDRIGIQQSQPSFGGIYTSREQNHLYAMQWSASPGTWFLQGGLSVNQFDLEQELGNLHIMPSDISVTGRFDADRTINPTARMSMGLECERLTNTYRGSIPRNPLVFDPAADRTILDDELSAVRVGGYAEMEARIAPRLTMNIGIRADHHSLSHTAVADPRASLRYDLGERSHLRFGWGIYHQFPRPYLYNASSGNPHLGPQRAMHIVAGLESSDDLVLCRVEVYRKTYDRMVLRSASLQYENTGNGTASGVDLFLKYGGFLRTPVSGWISYSYLHSRRLQVRDLVANLTYEDAPSSYDITHNLTVVGKIQVVPLLDLGLTFRYATGMPVTPVVAAVRDRDGDFYAPIEGPVNSERMPASIRLDATLSYFQPFGEAHSVTFYCGVSNLLGRANPVRYEYNMDYTQRHLRTSDIQRFIYFGASLSLGSIDARG